MLSVPQTALDTVIKSASRKFLCESCVRGEQDDGVNEILWKGSPDQTEMSVVVVILPQKLFLFLLD